MLSTPLFSTFTSLLSLVSLVCCCLPVSPVEDPIVPPTWQTTSSTSTSTTTTTTTTTDPPCCPITIFDDKAATGRALFNPELRECPTQATFICSVRNDLNKDPTTIQMNGNTVVATGPNGMNTMVTMQCRTSDRTWVYNDKGTTIVVAKITCFNNAVVRDVVDEFLSNSLVDF